MTRTLIAADIGGTHARFALAEVAGGRVLRLHPAWVTKCAEHASLQLAWEAFAATLGARRPDAAAIAIATPIAGEVLKMTNNPWVIRPALVGEKLGVGDHVLVNDFEAVAHAVAQAPAGDFRHCCGPDGPLPEHGPVTIVGPGTGLGVALLLNDGDDYRVVPTEGGHIDFAPTDAIEDAILAHMRRRFRRVSAERIVSGPGLAEIHAALAALEGQAIVPADDKALWSAALAGADSLAAAALDRFCLALGGFAGDVALVQGAKAVVIAGGLGARLADHLPRSGFRQRFAAKGRFEALMNALPVKLIAHPQPGLFGAAAAFARTFR